MEWWLIGFKVERSGETLYLISDVPRLALHRPGIILAYEGRRGRVSPGVWLMRGGELLDEPQSTGMTALGHLPDVARVAAADPCIQRHVS